MGIESWSTTAGSNNSESPNGAPEGMPPGGVNNTIRQIMASVRAQMEAGMWFNWGHTPTYVSVNSFTVSGDQTSIYQVGRRLKLYGPTMGTVYRTITGSVYVNPDTTVTVASGGVLADITTVSVSLIEATNNTLPLDVSDLVTFTNFPAHKGALLYLASSYSLADSTFTNISWTAEQYDTDDYHEANSSSITIPSGTDYGYARIHASIQFATGVGNMRIVSISKVDGGGVVGDTSVSASPVSGGSTDIYISTPVLAVNPGNSFRLSAYQDSGGALGILGGAAGSWIAIEAIY